MKIQINILMVIKKMNNKVFNMQYSEEERTK